MAASNRKKAEMYILFSCNAWHEYSSFEPKAVFSSIEKAADFLQITWYSPVPTIQSAQETWNDKESIHKQSYKNIRL